MLCHDRGQKGARRLADHDCSLADVPPCRPTPPCHQFYFIIIMTSHPRAGSSENSKELTLLALMGIPSIPGVFEFKRPPRAPADVQRYMNRDPPFQRRDRRFGSDVVGKTTDVKASMHAAAMSKAARELLRATSTAGA